MARIRIAPELVLDLMLGGKQPIRHRRLTGIEVVDRGQGPLLLIGIEGDDVPPGDVECVAIIHTTAARVEFQVAP